MAITIDINTFRNTIGYEALTVDSTSGGVGFTATKFQNIGTWNDAAIAVLTLDGTAGTNDIRWTTDGTAPVATTTGHLLKAGDCLILRGNGNLAKFRAIREGGSSGKLQCSFFN